MHKRSVLNEGNDVDTTQRIPCCQEFVHSPKHTDSLIVAQIEIKVLKRQDLDGSEHGSGAPSVCMGRYSEDTGVPLGHGLPSVRQGVGASSGGWPMFKVHSSAGCSSATP